MKIALINKVFSQTGGGAERYAVDLAETMLRYGHEVHLYGNVIKGVDERAITHHVPMARKPGFRKILSFSKNAAKVLDPERDSYDAIYALTQAYPADLYFMGGGAHKRWLEIRMPNPVWRFIRCVLNPTHFAQMWIEDQIFKAKNCSMILANSHLIKEHAIKYGNVTPERVAVVHNGVDRTRFNPEVKKQFRTDMRVELGLQENELGLLFVSHNWPRKGLSTIINALGRLGESGKRYKLIVAGKGKEKPFLELASANNIPHERIKFMGSYPQPEKLYAACDVFVLPTMYDPCAGVTVEAMACSLPAITSRDNGAHELITQGESGYILDDPNDSATLAVYLEKLLDDDTRERLGKKAAIDIEPRTFDLVVKETIAVLEKISSEKKRKSEK